MSSRLPGCLVCWPSTRCSISIKSEEMSSAASTARQANGGSAGGGKDKGPRKKEKDKASGASTYQIQVHIIEARNIMHPE